MRRREVSVGTRRRVLSGALLGLTGGAAAGALAGAPSRCYKDGGEVPCIVSLDFGRGFSVMAGGVLGGVAGLVTGLLVASKLNERRDVARSCFSEAAAYVKPPPVARSRGPRSFLSVSCPAGRPRGASSFSSRSQVATRGSPAHRGVCGGVGDAI